MEEVMNAASTVITYTDYRQYKAELDAELKKSTESFVRIGYLLKVARDTGILRDSGYANVNEFAQKEYELDKSQVSRFIKINDRFSEDGYSEQLKTEYRGYGHAKLAIMLQLPDEITEELSTDYSKSEIQALKEEYDAEQRITELEVMMEEKDEIQQSLDDTLQQVVYQMGKDDPVLYVELWNKQMITKESDNAFIECLAPSGTKTYSVRIPGKGRMSLMIKENGEEIKLINMRDVSDKQTYTQEDVAAAFAHLFTGEDAKTSWSDTYGEPFPKTEKKPEVAPVQPKKESKVVKAKKPTSKPKPKIEKPKTEKLKEESKEEMKEQQLPGQDSIENHPEYMPDTTEDEAVNLQRRAYEIVVLTLSASLKVWKDKSMSLEAIQNNKKRAEELVELLEKLEQLRLIENK